MQDLGGMKKDQGKKISWNCGETTDGLKEISEAVLKYRRQKIEEIEPYTIAKWPATEAEHRLWAAGVTRTPTQNHRSYRDIAF